MRYLILIFLPFVLFACQSSKTQTGLDVITDYPDLFKNKKVGIITNHTAYNSESEHIVDVFSSWSDVSVTALFGPEHGIRGSEDAGVIINSEKDTASQIPIFSLYGMTRKPTPEMLANVDVLVFDIQDIGARFYTYIYTMTLAIEAAAENDIPFIVLDRPNPINGISVEGNILEPEYATFVGLYPIPVRHGMTIGEIAKMVNNEGWLKNGVKADLKVIPMKNWPREKWYDETGLKFIKPSPNMLDLISATLYPGTCLLEGTNVSEGRGTATPFRIFGAPWINSAQLTEKLNELRLPGVTFRDTSFTPVTIPGAAENPKYEKEQCFGAFVKLTDRDVLKPYLTGIFIVNTIYQLYGDSLQWRVSHFDRLCGTSKIRTAIIDGKRIDEVVKDWQTELQDFMRKRKKYLLYK